MRNRLKTTSDQEILVTVVMPVRGGCTWLGEALTSVKNQTFKGWKFVAYLDGPNPDAARIIASFGNKFSYLQSERNIGAAEARNRVIQHASTEFIASLDYDDVWPEDHLANLLKLVQSSRNVVLVGAAASTIDPQGRATGQLRRVPTRFLKFQLLFRNCFVHSSVVYRRDAAIQAGLYDPEMKRTYDYDLWLRLALLGRIMNSAKSMVLYRSHEAQQSLTPPSQIFSDKIRASKKNLASSVGLPSGIANLAHWAWERRTLARKV